MGLIIDRTLSIGSEQLAKVMKGSIVLLPDPPPLLVTLAMDAASFADFDALRRQHFPPARNHIPAHITLFHHLPAAEEATVVRVLNAVAAAYAPFALHTTGVWFLGYGSAFRLESAEATALHANLSRAFEPWLTPQDRVRHFKPHITVQNKAPVAEAKALYAKLTADFTTRPVTAVGFDLWEYRGGPWRHCRRFAFGL